MECAQTAPQGLRAARLPVRWIFSPHDPGSRMRAIPLLPRNNFNVVELNPLHLLEKAEENRVLGVQGGKTSPRPARIPLLWPTPITKHCPE